MEKKIVNDKIDLYLDTYENVLNRIQFKIPFIFIDKKKRNVK